MKMLRTAVTLAMLMMPSAAMQVLAKEDPRLATAKTAFVVAKDNLGDDKPVAISLADRLAKITPLASVESKEQADLLLRVRAHIPGTMGRGLLSPTVWLCWPRRRSSRHAAERHAQGRDQQK